MRKLALFFILMLMLMPILVLAQVDRERYFPAIRTDGKITAGDTLVSLKGLRVNGNIRGFKGTFSDTLVTLRGIRSEGPSRLKGPVTIGTTGTTVVISAEGKITAADTGVFAGARIQGSFKQREAYTGVGADQYNSNDLDFYFSPVSDMSHAWNSGQRWALEAKGIVPATSTKRVTHIGGLSGYAVNYGSGGVQRKMIGMIGNAENYGTGVIDDIIGLASWGYNNVASTTADVIGTQSASEVDLGTVTNLIGHEIWTGMGGGTVTNWYGEKIGMDAWDGTVTNRYGIYINDFSGLATNDYAFYSASTAKSYFTGKVTGNDTLVATKGFRSEGPIRVKDTSTFGATATPVVISTAGDVTAAGHGTFGTVTVGKNLTVNATEGAESITAPMVTGGWTLGFDTGGWSITAGVLSKTASTGTQTATAVSGMTITPVVHSKYKVVIVCSAVSGSLTYTLGGVTGTTITATTITDYIVVRTTDKIILSGGAAVTCTITSISIKKLTDDTGEIFAPELLTSNISAPGSGTRAIYVSPIGNVGVGSEAYQAKLYSYTASGTDAAMSGYSSAGSGVYGLSNFNSGVSGNSTEGHGVAGTSGIARAAYFYRNNVLGTATLPVVEINQQSATSETNTALKVVNSGTGDILNLFDGANEVATVVDGGSVGIGTTAPGAKFEVNSNKSADTTAIFRNDRVGRDSLTCILPDGSIGQNGRVVFGRVVSLVDGAQYLMPTGIAGFGRVYCGTEYATFTFTSAGVVTIVAAGTAGLTSANVTTIEDNDATLNIFDDGSGIGIENELGSTYNTLIDITYYTP